MKSEMLKKFIENSTGNSISGRKYYHFEYEESEGKGKARLIDDRGYEVSIPEAALIIEGLNNAYMIPDEEEVNDYLNKRNAKNALQDDLRFEALRIRGKLFRIDRKRNWGFTCASCKKKIISEDNKIWWVIEGYNYNSDDKYCSEECANPLYIEMINEIKNEVAKKYSVLKSDLDTNNENY